MYRRNRTVQRQILVGPTAVRGGRGFMTNPGVPCKSLVRERSLEGHKFLKSGRGKFQSDKSIAYY